MGLQRGSTDFRFILLVRRLGKKIFVFEDLKLAKVVIHERDLQAID